MEDVLILYIMKQLFLIPLLICLLFILVEPGSPDTDGYLRTIQQKKLKAISCVPERSRALVEGGIGLLPGSGSYHWKVSSNDSAQVYFDQGINMFYSFHIIESLASFVKAQKFDPQNAMPYWGEALTYSPNINDVGYVQPPDALKAVDNAKKYASTRSGLEQALIKAMVERYSADANADRQKLNEQYRDAMGLLADKFSSNADVIALYSDAMMVMHPWDLYNGDGSPKEWTPLLVQTLEKGLKINNRHPGLNHYYIHAVEGSTMPQRGLTSADKLADLVPGAAHMVHMPSHIYIRTGNYSKGIDVNVKALEGYAKYLAIDPTVQNAAFLYQFHNTHMLAACAIMNGNYDVARKSSLSCEAEVSPEYHNIDGPMAEFMQYVYATPVFAYVRYGKWDELLKEKTIADSSIYLQILYSFGRGIAHSRQGHIADAEKELAFITDQMEKHTRLKERAFNTAYDGADIAKHMLGGIIAEQKNDLAKAEELLRKASIIEENMVYNEPKDWILPPLPYLGSVLIKEKKYAEAEQIFKKDLAFNPNNCWALKGLHEAQMAQGKKKDAGKSAEMLSKALEGSNMTLQNAVF